MPVGLEMIGREFAEFDLIRLAYAFEQATGHRRPPDSTPSLLAPPPPVVVEVETPAAPGPGLRGRFELDRARRELAWSVSVHGVVDGDVLFSHLHRAVEGGGAGPVAHLLGGRGQARASGRLVLSARDVQSLRDGRLYVAAHTADDLPGIRADLVWPAE